MPLTFAWRLAQATQQPSPDALEHGQRYVELEAIRRELSDRKRELNEDSVGVLTADQRTEL